MPPPSGEEFNHPVSHIKINSCPGGGRKPRHDYLLCKLVVTLALCSFLYSGTMLPLLSPSWSPVVNGRLEWGLIDMMSHRPFLKFNCPFYSTPTLFFFFGKLVQTFFWASRRGSREFISAKTRLPLFFLSFSISIPFPFLFLHEHTHECPAYTYRFILCTVEEQPTLSPLLHCDNSDCARTLIVRPGPAVTLNCFHWMHWQILAHIHRASTLQATALPRERVFSSSSSSHKSGERNASKNEARGESWQVTDKRAQVYVHKHTHTHTHSHQARDKRRAQLLHVHKQIHIRTDIHIHDDERSSGVRLSLSLSFVYTALF